MRATSFVRRLRLKKPQPYNMLYPRANAFVVQVRISPVSTAAGEPTPSAEDSSGEGVSPCCVANLFYRCLQVRADGTSGDNRNVFVRRGDPLNDDRVVPDSNAAFYRLPGPLELTRNPLSTSRPIKSIALFFSCSLSIS